MNKIDEAQRIKLVAELTKGRAKFRNVGPEAGDKGGTIVAQGKPEVVVKSKASRFAPFIHQALNQLNTYSPTLNLG